MSHQSNSTSVSQGPEAPTEIQHIVSDGRFTRMVWRPGDGDGDSDQSIVYYFKNKVAGHPTWRIYIDNVKIPITRGTPDEPPRYCYLDDRACYAIYCSKKYSNKEMYEFWPWDFDYVGKIKHGRHNRGNPAYPNDTNAVFAQGDVRGSRIPYTFSGGPGVMESKPSKPKKDRQMEVVVVAQDAEEVDQGKANKDTINQLDAGDAKPEDIPASKTKAMLPTSESLYEHYSSLFSSAQPPSTEVDVLEVIQNQLSLIPSSSIHQGRIMALPHSCTHNSASPVKSPGIRGDLGASSHIGELIESNSKTFNEDSPMETTPLKRKLEMGIDLNSNSPTKQVCPNTSRLGCERVKSIEELPCVDHNGINIDDDNDYEVLALSGIFLSPSQANMLQARVKDFKHELEATNAHAVTISRERDAFRHVIVKLLAGNKFQLPDLTNRIISLQKLTDSVTLLCSDAQKIASGAKSDIEPTAALCDGIGTVLDGPGKYMYSRGMDEEWKDLQNEASKMVEKYK